MALPVLAWCSVWFLRVFFIITKDLKVKASFKVRSKHITDSISPTHQDTLTGTHFCSKPHTTTLTSIFAHPHTLSFAEPPTHSHMTTHTHQSTRTRIRPTKVEIEFLTELLSFKIDDVFKLSLFFSSTEIESGRECVRVREKEREKGPSTRTSNFNRD